jgi:hypothetical protein
MLKLASIAFAALAMVGMTAMSPAQAGYGGGTHIHSSYSYHTVHHVTNVTHYRTIAHTNYVTKVTRVVNVTRIQPIHHVTNVTRYLHHTVVLNSRQYASRTSVAPTRYYRTSSVVPIRGPVVYGGVHTVYRYHTVNHVTYSTHVHNIWVNHYQHNIYRHVTVTRIEPIVNVHTVTRVVTRTVALSKVEVVYVTKLLPARTIVTAKVINIDP